MATGDDLDDTLEKAAHLALMQFYEHHLTDTVVALFPIRDVGDPTWSECFSVACDTACQTYHEGWAFMVRYTRLVSSLLQEVTIVGAHQRRCLEEYNHQVEAKDHLIADLRKGNRELL
jgi:hypothetical protein